MNLSLKESRFLRCEACNMMASSLRDIRDSFDLSLCDECWPALYEFADKEIEPLREKFINERRNKIKVGQISSTP